MGWDERSMVPSCISQGSHVKLRLKFAVNSTTNNTTHIDVHSEQFGEQKPTNKNLPSGFARSFTKLCRDCGLYVTQIYSDDWALPYNLGKSDMAKGNPPLFNGKISMRHGYENKEHSTGRFV